MSLCIFLFSIYKGPKLLGRRSNEDLTYVVNKRPALEKPRNISPAIPSKEENRLEKILSCLPYCSYCEALIDNRKGRQDIYTFV